MKNPTRNPKETRARRRLLRKRSNLRRHPYPPKLSKHPELAPMASVTGAGAARRFEFAPGESVAVTRRLYRSGRERISPENRICRLRDIQDLFSGTGLSGAHYAIVEQGRIGQILSAKPMDRRTLIEEAAGITKFRVRQRAAEARLDSARGNLSRVSDIVSEIDRQVNSLRRQAGKARRYRCFARNFGTTAVTFMLRRKQRFRRCLRRLGLDWKKPRTSKLPLAAELTVREEEVRSSTHAARALEEELSKARATAAEAALNRDRRQREKSYQQEQAQSLDRRRVEVPPRSNSSGIG